MKEINEFIEFEEALDELISSKLKDIKQERIKEHFGGVTLYEYIKLVVWSSKSKGQT